MITIGMIMPTTIPVIVVTLLPDPVSVEVRGRKIKVASSLISSQTYINSI